MKRYRVDGGVARLGPGEVVGLTNEQLALRAHRVEVVQKLAAENGVQTGAIVRAKELIEFKVGEQIALRDLPRNLTDILVPLDKVETVTEKVAVEKTRVRKREAALVKARKGAGNKRR